MKRQSNSSRWTRSPHVSLAVAIGVVLVLEGFRGAETLGTSPIWPLAQALVAVVALGIAWVARARLRLSRVLLLGAAFHVGWVVLHLALGVPGDHDSLDVYPAQGDVLLRGDYPESEYPPGAVALFALETWLGGGSARTANAFVMIPFQLACVAAVWSLRTQWTPWLATFIALWPLNAFYWEFRFDLVPVAGLLVGLALAWRERWYEAGFVLGLATIVKWTPALACLALLLWLVRARRLDRAAVHLGGFAIPVLVANVPLLLWKPSELLYAYTTQGARTVTAESFVFLPLHLFWDSEPGYWYFGAADVPAAANTAAIWFQAIVILLLLACCALARTRSAAIALAGFAPAAFLLTNRIFSPQFFVLVLAAIVVAAALVVCTPTELFAVMGASVVAMTANTVLFQSFLGARPVESVSGWIYISALTFIPTLAIVAWLAGRALLQREETPIVPWTLQQSSPPGLLARATDAHA